MIAAPCDVVEAVFDRPHPSCDHRFVSGTNMD
jgi:hypothetical protein